MKKISVMAHVAILVFLFGGALAFAEGEKKPADDTKAKAAASEQFEVTLTVPALSPLFENVPVAVVNDETITLGNLKIALVSSHGGEGAGTVKQAARVDFKNMLKRLVNVRLIIQEARNIGLGDLPEVKESVDGYSKSALREVLVEDIQKDVKADKTIAEQLYKNVIRQWKIKSVMFPKEEDAKKMEEELKAGKGFDELASKAIDEKKAEGNKKGGYVKPKDLLPPVVEVVSTMKPGDVSPVIKIGGEQDAGYVVLKLEDVSYPDDPYARARAEETVLDKMKIEAVRTFEKNYITDNVKINQKLLKNLDYESPKPGIGSLTKDKRVIATVKGGKPITVSDLTEGLKEKFFHGLEKAAESKKLNDAKSGVLDKLIEKRIFAAEAEKRGIAKTTKYRNKMKEYEDSVIFDLFLRKVVIPDIKITEEDMKTYYKDHIKDFSYPEMVKLDSLVFGKPDEAESAVAKLKEGADFAWMKSNTEGQLPKDTKGLISFEGGVIATKELPEGVQKAISGVRSGDFRLYRSPEGYVYVLYVEELVPSREEPFEGVQKDISRKVFVEKLNKSIEDYAGKLKEAADIRIFLSDSDTGKDTEKAN